MSESTLLNSLNPQQKQAVTHTTKSPLLIIAGAGTGKTTVITYKIAWLIEQKLAKPEEILALAFTDKAAEEMETRVDQLMPYGIFDLWISTFHAFCQRILENHALDIGLSPDYRLLNTTESWLLLRQNLYKLALDYYRPKGNPSKFIHALIKLFSRLKDENIAPEEYLKYAENLAAGTDTTMSDESLKLETQRIKETADCYFQYQQLLLDNNFLDFGDLIYYTNKLFLQRPNILKKYQKQFKYILVDEFQDTNLAQYQLINLLAKPSRLSPSPQLTVVGDDDQAIFKFRGASVSNVLNFKKDFPNSTEIVLTKNYRSCQNILNTAYRFIQHNNPDRLEYQLNNSAKYFQEKLAIKVKKISKKLSAQKPGQGIIEFLPATEARGEVHLVIEKIKELLNKPGNSLNDIAILVRANKSAELYISALEQEKIPHIYLGSSGLYKQPIIMDILALARVLYDRADSVSLSRFLQIPWLGLPDQEILKINYWARRKAHNLYETLENIRALPNLSEATIKRIENLTARLRENTKLAKEKSAVEMFLKLLADTNYREHLLALEQENPAQALQQAGFLNQFLRKMQQFKESYEDKRLKSFIDHIDLELEAGDRGSLDQNLAEQGPEAIKIMTVHSAKGLEFKYVFIVNLAQQKFPTSKRSELISLPDDLIAKKEILPEGDEHLEEERRLFYVALTRAKEGIYLSIARNYGGRRDAKISQFLKEAEIVKNKESFPSPRTTDKRQTSFSDTFPTTTVTIFPPSQNPNSKLQIPAQFSYSQIAAFRKCPRQYKYQFILKIPQDKGKGVFSFGQTMHSVMREIFQQIKIRASFKQTSLFGGVPKQDEPVLNKPNLINLEEIYKIYQQKWIDDWYESPESKDNYQKAGKKILKVFFELHQKNWPIPLYLEKDFKISLASYILKGRIDRIDKIEDNGGIEIIDYKTGKYKDKLDKDDKTQLLIYQIALEGNNPPPQKLTYYYLNDQKQGKISFIGQPEEMIKAKKELVETIEKIKESDFPAKPGEFTCSYCDFRNICSESMV